MRVLAFGTFDLLHEGHLAYLKEAATLGRELYVLVACDQAVMFAKNHAPEQSEQTRLKKIQQLPFVRQALLGKPVKNRNDYLKTITELKPDIIALGYDQFLEHTEWLKSRLDPKTKIVRLKAYRPEVYKTTLLKSQIANSKLQTNSQDPNSKIN